MHHQNHDVLRMLANYTSAEPSLVQFVVVNAATVVCLFDACEECLSEVAS